MGGVTPPASPPASRQDLGLLGEQLALEHLQRRGFALVERNYRSRWGELDLIVRGDDVLVFCEVKTRQFSGGAPADASAALEAIGPRKRRQVRSIARRWLNERRKRPLTRELRFDAIGVTVDRAGRLIALEHLENAF